MKTTAKYQSFFIGNICPALAAIAITFSNIRPASAAIDTWTGSTDTNWSDAGNWTGGNAPPQAGDSLIFGSTSGATALNNNLTAGIAIDGINFSGGSAFTLNGNGILLSGQIYSNSIGVTNSSGLLQTFGTLPLTLDWGLYTFSSSSGTIALDGGLTLKTGGVAFFDANNTTSLTNDSSGLISGLGGAGLMYNPSTGNPSGLAAINGSSNIVAYTGYTTVATGAISSGGNIELTASGATGTYTAANGTSVNTITALQAGTQTSTLTVTGTLTLGGTSGIGGIYALDGSGGSTSNLLTVTGGILTAGTTSAGGTIVLGGNDSTAHNFAPNVATIASAIQDNGSGGKVSVVKVGVSSMSCSSATNTYSGGLYILQGQIQAGNSWGSGPIYIGPGATLYYNNSAATNDSHNFFLSPGTGTGLQLNSGSQGATLPGALFLNSTVNFTNPGVITLLGPGGTFTSNEVIAANAAPTPGSRITGQNADTYTFASVITGTGMLDLCSSPANSIFQFNNTNADNTWSGGLLIETPETSPSSARTVLVTFPTSGNGFNGHVQIPHGVGKGDVMLYSASAVSGSLARLNLENNSITINGLYGYSAGGIPANVVVENSDNVQMCTLTMGDGNANGYYGGVVLDPNSETALTKIGTGTQVFTGSIASFGPTTVSNGTLTLANGSSLPNCRSIIIASAGTLDVTGMNGGNGLTLGAAQTLNCVGEVLGNLTINGSVESLDAIGTFTESGNMTLNSGSTNIWNINKAGGTAGTDPGWSQLNIAGGLTIAGPFTISVNSLTLADAPGAVLDFNNAQSYTWSIAHTTAGISGFTAGMATVNTNGFANSLGQGQFIVTTNATDLLLSFVVPPAITRINVNVVGDTVAISGTNGPPNVGYSVLSTTNITANLTNWTQVGTGTVGGNGGFTFNGSISPTDVQRYYVIVIP